MLKKSASIVLGSSKSSTYPRGYASGFDSPAALLDEFLSILREGFSVGLDVRAIEFLSCHNSFSATC
jgi:hypothetical protein